jgi:hypothetical protein
VKANCALRSPNLHGSHRSISLQPFIRDGRGIGTRSNLPNDNQGFWDCLCLPVCSHGAEHYHYRGAHAASGRT